MVNEFSQALTEINEILKLSDESIIKKIPYEFRQMVVQNMDKTYKPNIDIQTSLESQNLKPKTKDLITLIYKNYIAEDTERELLIQKEVELLKYRKNTTKKSKS